MFSSYMYCPDATSCADCAWSSVIVATTLSGFPSGIDAISPFFQYGFRFSTNDLLGA